MFWARLMNSGSEPQPMNGSPHGLLQTRAVRKKYRKKSLGAVLLVRTQQLKSPRCHHACGSPVNRAGEFYSPLDAARACCGCAHSWGQTQMERPRGLSRLRHFLLEWGPSHSPSYLRTPRGTSFPTTLIAPLSCADGLGHAKREARLVCPRILPHPGSSDM